MENNYIPEKDEIIFVCFDDDLSCYGEKVDNDKSTYLEDGINWSEHKHGIEMRYWDIINGKEQVVRNVYYRGEKAIIEKDFNELKNFKGD